MELIQEAIINGLVGIVVALIAVFSTGVQKFIKAKSEQVKTKTKDTEWQMLQSIGMTVVTAVEQIAKTVKIDGSTKYSMAIDMLDKELNQRGFDLTDEQKGTLIESGVKAMNDFNNSIYDELTGGK